MEEKIKEQQELAISKMVSEIWQDFEKRRSERKNIEAQWQLNNNFLMGNQYCGVFNGDVEDYQKQYFWQEREVFNHIAPLIEARLSKLSRIKPVLNVLPSSAEESDFKVAKLSRDILNSAIEKIDLYSKIADATKWSEVCGTSFYKVIWNAGAGKSIAVDEKQMPVCEGEVNVIVVPPYEIFPESSSCCTIDECGSIIHAKAYSARSIKNIWGADVEGEDIDVFSLSSSNMPSGLGVMATASKVINSVKSNHAIVVEKYEAPTVQYPNGRLVIICKDKLLYIGELPYINATEKKRGYPFIRQVSNSLAGSFWGSSIIERMIPVQRAYNAVKNRKHEFLNRLSMGVLAVEDGSVDADALEEEGLCPGKILVYRKGSTPPAIMADKSLPVDFAQEEERLIDEFTEISGISYYTRNNQALFNGNMSGVTLQMLLEQDDARLNGTIDSIKEAAKNIAKHILRLYKQYANTPRLLRLNNNRGEAEVYYFNKSDITSDDIVIDESADMLNSLAGKRGQIYELLKLGVFEDDNGKISKTARNKILDVLGFGAWENGVDLTALHMRRAQKENLKILRGEDVEVSPLDESEVHINAHIAFYLSKEFEDKLKKEPQLEEKLVAHINAHKKEV